MNNIKINCMNVDEKFLEEYKNFFKNYEICKCEENLEEIRNSIKIDSENKLYNDYFKFMLLYKNGGLLIDGNFEFLYSINSFFNSNFFISYVDDKNISTNLVWVKDKNSNFIKKILDCIELNKYSTITDVFSDVLEKKLFNNYNSLQMFENKIYLYPYEYFYPIDYEYIGKSFTDNMKSIYYEKGREISKKTKLKIKLARKYGVNSFNYFFSILRILKNNIGYKRYIMKQNIKKKFTIKQDSGVENAIKKLDEYIYQNAENIPVDYIIIHNPNWLGVTSATKELFKNLVPLEEVYLDKNINNIASKIIQLGVNQVIFSAFDYGWDKIAIKLKELNPNIKIKSFWHGSHSQVIEKINWETNTMIIGLHKKGIIDVMGTCKESLVNFYKSQGYTTAFLNNTVVLNEEIKEKIKNNKNDEKSNGIKLGLYSAGTDWRKNTYNQVMAASLFENATLEIIPLRYELEKVAFKNNLKVTGSSSHLKREELLLEMAKNDITLYVTFSECAPMLPIESLEVGTICITGNNHHYFDGSKLYDYLVVEREDDVMEIYEKIKYALAHEEEIFKLYKEWKKENDIRTKSTVKEFLEM